MSIKYFSVSESFFECSEPLADPETVEFGSLRGRGLSLLNFFEKLAIVPFSFLFKLYKTFCRLVGVVLGAILLIVTLCSAPAIREFFVERVSYLARDLADWVLWPIAVFSCLTRLLLGAFVHPAFYFGF